MRQGGRHARPAALGIIPADSNIRTKLGRFCRASLFFCAARRHGLSAHQRLKYHLFRWNRSSLKTSAILKAPKEPCAMHIASPFVVVPVILAVFTAAILYATGSKEDGDSSH
jgi:hypothetical protein